MSAPVLLRPGDRVKVAVPGHPLPYHDAVVVALSPLTGLVGVRYDEHPDGLNEPERTWWVEPGMLTAAP